MEDCIKALLRQGQDFIRDVNRFSPNTAPEARPTPITWFLQHSKHGGTLTSPATNMSALQQLLDQILSSRYFDELVYLIQHNDATSIFWDAEKICKESGNPWDALIFTTIASGFDRYIGTDPRWLHWKSKHTDAWMQPYREDA